MPTEITVKELYQLCTGDMTAHQRRIDGHLRKLSARRQRIIRARITARRLRDIAQEEGISYGTVQKEIERSMEKIRKAIAGEPRYKTRGSKASKT
jgi:DNA-directed RNA polymerase specialized sigma24 family protein